MKKNIIILLLFTIQCSTKNQHIDSFIQYLTSNTWYKPDPNNPHQASTTIFTFNKDGSFIQDFVGLDKKTVEMTFEIDSVEHNSFAYYFFDYPFRETKLRLYTGIGVGTNTIANKSSIYQSIKKKDYPQPTGLYTEQQAIDWYKQQYSKGNLITHRGTTLAIQ